MTLIEFAIDVPVSYATFLNNYIIGTRELGSINFLMTLHMYRTSGVIFFHRLLHSYTQHIERVDRGERDIVPSAQD